MAFKNKNIVREGPFFTHFACIPFIDAKYRAIIQDVQTSIRALIQTHPKYEQPDIKEHGHNQCHITLFKLVLRHSQSRQKMKNFMTEHHQLIKQALAEMTVTITNINYFTRFNKNKKCKQVTVIYAEIDAKSKDRINKLADKLIRVLLAEQIIASNELKDMNVIYDHTTNLYKPETLHISLFRARNMLEDEPFLAIFKELQQRFQPFEAECHYLDISTMGKEYDQTEFYLPLHRTHLKGEQPTQNNKVKQSEKKQIMSDLY